MRMMRIATAAAALLAGLPGVASAAEPVCLTHDEATALIAYALPQAIDGTAKRCAAVLPPKAFLRQHGSELASRYAGQKDKYWPQAKPAFMKALGPDAARTVGGLPDDTTRQLADTFVEGFVSQRIALKSCDKLDIAFGLLSPLPPQNTAGLIALTMEVASKAEPKVGKIALCKN